MNAAARLAGFVAVLALAFGGAVAAGDAFGPEPAEDDTPAMPGHQTTTEPAGHAAAMEPSAPGAARPVRGLAVAENGLRVEVENAELRRARTERLRFRIVDESGDTVRDFEVEHTKRMHLILARRDLTGFQHLHPVQEGDGSWAADVRIPAAGSYRLFADFTRGGEPFTLASDLRVDGRAQLRDLPESAPLAAAGAGYSVRLDTNPVRAGRAAELRFVAHRNGRAVRVEPYLGAGGHLVALREGDMAFLHVHPIEAPRGEAADGSIGFESTFPTEGRYRLFLQFKHDGRVRTAAFTQEVL